MTVMLYNIALLGTLSITYTLTLPHFTLAYLTLSHLAVPTLPYLALQYMTLPYLALPSNTNCGVFPLPLFRASAVLACGVSPLLSSGRRRFWLVGCPHFSLPGVGGSGLRGAFSLSARSLFALCSLSVRSLFALCSLSGRSLFALCSLSARSQLALCSLSVCSARSLLVI